MILDDFRDGETPRWSFFTDQVMGGVSTGTATLESEAGTTFLRLKGDVSTRNNGGFIQARLALSEPLPGGAEGIEIEVRGTPGTYYIHLRTRGTVLPWQFYQAPFEAGDDWTVVRIPFADFAAKGGLLRGSFTPSSLRSLALAAYGRDHAADVSLRRIATY